MQTAKPPVFALSSGEPAGIGPDLCLLLAECAQPYPLVVLGNAELLRERAALLGVQIELLEIGSECPRTPAPAHHLYVQNVPLCAPVIAGQLNPGNAPYVLQLLQHAVDGCVAGRFAGMITAPVHKGVINDAGIPFSGHTELLAERTGTPQVVMMLATPGLRVALATTHLPLREVADALTPQHLERVLHILIQDMQDYFGVQRPRILVCGLNPHAGEGGHLGHEEIDVIEPVLTRLRQAGHDLVGPLPADSLFTPYHLEHADAVLAMYHDQGLPVLKYKGFGAAVNITLGLPIIRTSVDHGTALDKAGRGDIDRGSLDFALQTAYAMASSRATRTASAQ